MIGWYRCFSPFPLLGGGVKVFVGHRRQNLSITVQLLRPRIQQDDRISACSPERGPINLSLSFLTESHPSLSPAGPQLSWATRNQLPAAHRGAKTAEWAENRIPLLANTSLAVLSSRTRAIAILTHANSAARTSPRAGARSCTSTSPRSALPSRLRRGSMPPSVLLGSTPLLRRSGPSTCPTLSMMAFLRPPTRQKPGLRCGPWQRPRVR